MAIDISAVVIGPQFGEGGFGAVHEAVMVGTPIADDARPMVLKTPKPGVDPVHAAAVLEGMRRAVEFRDGLGASDRHGLDEIAVWPVAMVQEQGREMGCLLPSIPPAFYMDIAANGSFPEKRVPRDLGYLSASTKRRQNVGYDSGDFRDYALRLLVLAKLAGAIELLHRHEMVFGDLGPRSAVFTFMPPACCCWTVMPWRTSPTPLVRLARAISPGGCLPKCHRAARTRGHPRSGCRTSRPTCTSLGSPSRGSSTGQQARRNALRSRGRRPRSSHNRSSC